MRAADRSAGRGRPTDSVSRLHRESEFEELLYLRLRAGLANRLMEARGKPRHLAAGRIAIQRSLAPRLIEQPGRLAQFFLGRLRIAAGDRLNRLFDGAVDAALDCAIVLAAFQVLPTTLLRGRMYWNMRHSVI